MPPVARFRASEGHLVICGDDKLAYRLAQELSIRYRERVTVILPSERRGHGPDIDRLPGVRIIVRDELTSQAARPGCCPGISAGVRACSTGR